MAWLSGYSKRVLIPATYASAITNRQVALAIIKGSGSNAAGSIYLNNNALNWPYDIRFTKADGVTLLDYHRMEYDTVDGIWWIELDSVNGDTDFYLYYGKSDATDANSLGNTWNSGAEYWYNLNTFGYATAIGLHYGYSTNYNTPMSHNWPWQQPAAVYHDGKTYCILSVKSGSNYKSQVTYFNHSTSAWATPVDIGTWSDTDGHRAACITMDSSGYLYVFYGGSESNLYMRKSTKVKDISAWDSAVAVVYAQSDDASPGTDTGGTRYGATYPSAFCVGTDIYCFFRYTAVSATPVEKRVGFKKSTNGGATWSARTDVVSPGDNHNCYPTAIWDSTNSRCHIMWVDYDATAVKYDELYYAYSDNFTDWYNAAGDHSEANITDAEAESYYLVHACTTTQQIPCDLNVDSSGNPYILSQDSGKYHFHYYSSGWQTVDICDTGQSSAYGDGWLLAGCLIVNSSTDFKVYVTVDADGFADIDDDKGEIHEYSSSNKTAWKKTATVSNDSVSQTWGSNIPKRVHGGGKELPIIFSAGPTTSGSVYAVGYGSKVTSPMVTDLPFAFEPYSYGTSPEITLADDKATITLNASSETGYVVMSDAVASPVRYVRARFNPYACGNNYRFNPIALSWQKTKLEVGARHALFVLWDASNLYLYFTETNGGKLQTSLIKPTSPTANTWYICEMWHSGTTTHVKITKESDGTVICDADVTTYNYDSASLYPLSGCYAGSSAGTITAYVDYLLAGGYPRATWNTPGSEESIPGSPIYAYAQQ